MSVISGEGLHPVANSCRTVIPFGYNHAHPCMQAPPAPSYAKAASKGTMPPPPDLRASKMDAFFANLSSHFGQITQTRTAAAVASAVKTAQTTVTQMADCWRSVADAIKDYVSKVEVFHNDTKQIIDDLHKNVGTLQGQMRTLESDMAKRDKSVLVRSIVTCLEANATRLVKNVDPDYKGYTLRHLHYSTFQSDPDYEFSVASAKDVYRKFLRDHFHKDDKITSRDLADYVYNLKDAGTTVSHPVPPVEEQKLDDYKLLPIKLPAGATEFMSWSDLLNEASAIAKEQNKPLIYKL